MKNREPRVPASQDRLFLPNIEIVDDGYKVIGKALG